MNNSEPQKYPTQTPGEGQDPDTSGTGKPESGDTELLQKIREDFRFCLDYWSDNRDAAATDMRFVSGDPWTQDEKQKRAGRPCLSPDEISQYLKQANNNWRQNDRAIKVLPKGEGSTDADALKRAAIIRGIEYASDAKASRTRAFEASTSCGFGFTRITTKQMASGSGFDVEPRIAPIPNQFTVLLDPQAKKSDFSDQKICFVTDMLRKSKFEDVYPNAQKVSFNTEDANTAPDWFKGDSIVIAEYWCVSEKKRKKLKVRGEAGDTAVYEDELQEGDGSARLDQREEIERTVTQYITNGVEILEKNAWPGSWIPIIPYLGEEIYVNDGGQSKRIFMSLVRRAQVPQKMLCYIASQEAEEFGMAPRVPIVLWEGQEDADKKAWEQLNEVARAYIRVKPTVGPDGQLLPFLGRHPFTPNIEAYEQSRESWRRAVQAAMGISPLPTDAQRQNQKSGIALEKINDSEAIGSYHFTDNAERAMENEGRQINELITKVMDTKRMVSIRNPDDSHALMHVGAAENMQDHIGQPAPQPGDTSQLDYLISDNGEYDVTMSTGASFQSQREQSSDFVDTLLKELPAFQFPPATTQALVAKAVKMKDLGPMGDEIADLLDPQKTQGQQLAGLQAQLAQSQKVMGDMQVEMQKLQLEKAGKVIDNEYKSQIAQLNNDVKILIAEIGAKSQDAAQRAQMYQQFWVENHGAAHDLGLQKDQQAHEQDMAQKQAQVAAASQANEHMQQQSMQQQTLEAQPQENQ